MIVIMLWFINFIFTTQQTLKRCFEKTKGEKSDLLLPIRPQINTEQLSLSYKTLICDVEMIYGNNINDVIRTDCHMGSKIIVNLIDEFINFMLSLSEFNEFITQPSDKDSDNLKQKLISKLCENIFCLGENEIKTFINKVEQMDKSSWISNKELIKNNLNLLIQMMNIHLDFEKSPIVKNSNDKSQKIIFFLKFKNKNTKISYKTDLYVMYIKNGEYTIADKYEYLVHEVDKEEEKKKKSFLIMLVLGSIIILIVISMFISYIYRNKNKSVKPLSMP